MSNYAVKVLDTANPTSAPSDTGKTQTMKENFLKKDKPLRLSVDLASGDTVVIEATSDLSESFQTIHTFTTSEPADVYPSRYWRARRTVDGGVGDSQVFVEARFNEAFVEDSA